MNRTDRFRSEAEMEDWLTRFGRPFGATISVQLAFDLSRRWYEGRMDEDWTPPSKEASQEIFSSLGMVGEFWSLD